MALTRKFLSALGIDTDKVDEIINAHAETVEALKGERDKYKADVEKYKEDAEKLPSVQKELDELKKNSGSNADEFAKLKKEFEDYKAEVQAEKERVAKQNAYSEILKDAGIVSEKGVSLAMKYANFDELELGEDGKFTNASDLLKFVKEEWSDYVQTEGKKGADSPKPPKNDGNGTFAQMSLNEKMKYANEHPNDLAVKEFLK